MLSSSSPTCIPHSILYIFSSLIARTPAAAKELEGLSSPFQRCLPPNSQVRYGRSKINRSLGPAPTRRPRFSRLHQRHRRRHRRAVHKYYSSAPYADRQQHLKDQRSELDATARSARQPPVTRSVILAARPPAATHGADEFPGRLPRPGGGPPAPAASPAAAAAAGRGGALRLPDQHQGVGAPPPRARARRRRTRGQRRRPRGP